MFNRIAPQDNYAPTHPKANRWLTDFMIDLKLMKQGKTYQPFTMDRLNEWGKWVSPEYETCVDWESSFVKQQADLHDMLIHEHAGAIMHFNGVVIDLKLMVAGLEYSEITDERLIEADKAWHELVYCKKHLRIHY